MAYKVIILYRLYMPSYFLGTFTEYPYINLCFFCQRLCTAKLCCTFPTVFLFLMKELIEKQEMVINGIVPICTGMTSRACYEIMIYFTLQQ